MAALHGHATGDRRVGAPHGEAHPVSATLYIDPEDPVIDMQAAEAHFSRRLHSWGLANTLRIKVDQRFVGRSPLLVIDGGKLAECHTNSAKPGPAMSS